MTLYTVFAKTIQYLQGLFGIGSLPKISAEDLERIRWSKSVTSSNKQVDYPIICSRTKYLQTLTEPAKYFMDRGFSSEVLNEFDIRMYHLPQRRFSRRCVVPLYDEQNRYLLGISGRTIYNEQPKWLFTSNFPASTSLYGINHALFTIRKSHEVILVESPGNVWRLWEAGIKNSVALWGTSINLSKIFLLDRLGVMKVTVVLDNDSAGVAGAEMVVSALKKNYNVVRKEIPAEFNDIADMSINQTKKFFGK